MKSIIIALFLMNTVFAQANFKFVKGTVKKYYQDNLKETVKRGDTLEEGESVTLEEGAQIILKIADHSIQRIEGPATFTLDSLAYEFENSDEIEKPASLLMETGTFFIKVLKKSDNESMVVKTDSTTFGIRGTEFLLDIPKDKNIILSLNEGAVEVKNDNQADIIEKGGSLYIEGDSRFQSLRDRELIKNVNWDFDSVESKESFREYRQNNRKRIREKLSKWNRDDLKWNKFKEKRKEKLSKWKEKVSALKSSDKLKRAKERKRLRAQNREKSREKSQSKRQGMRDELRKKKIEELKKKKLNSPNSFINNNRRQQMRRRAREKMMERRENTAPAPGTSPPPPAGTN